MGYRAIQLIVYEGGAHITPMNENWEYIGLGINSDNINWDPYYEANSSPTIYDLYIKWAEAWYGNGGGMIMVFSYVSLFPGTYTTLAGEKTHMGTGVFGHLEGLDAELEFSYKYKALKDMMRK